MTDIEITKLCAEAMGFVAETFWGPICQIRGVYGVGTHRFSNTTSGYWTVDYDPLHDDAQAMALVKKLKLDCGRFPEGGQWWCADVCCNEPAIYARDLNRAVCEYVAKIQLSRHKPEHFDAYDDIVIRQNQ